MYPLPLLQVFSVPLVGAWVRGVRSLDHPLVAVACLRFGYSDTLPDRARAEGGSFLLLMYPPGEIIIGHLWNLSAPGK